MDITYKFSDNSIESIETSSLNNGDIIFTKADQKISLMFDDKLSLYINTINWTDIISSNNASNDNSNDDDKTENIPELEPDPIPEPKPDPIPEPEPEPEPVVPVITPVTLSNITKVSNPAITSDMYALEYANGTFIAGGWAGKVMTSTNGTTWTERNCTGNTNKFVYMLKAIGTTLYAGDNGGTLYKSTNNGSSWSNVQTLLTGYAYDVTNYSNAVLFGAGGGGLGLIIGTTTYKRTCNNFTAQVTAVCCGGSTFVAGNSSGRIAYSTYDSTVNNMFGYWNLSSSTVSGSIKKIIYEKSMFILITSNGDIATSTNGSSWTKRTSGVTTALNDIQYVNNRFIIVGNNGVILTSTNGTSWTKLPNEDTSNLNSITYFKNTYIAVGKGGIIIASNNDKINTLWTKQNSPVSSDLVKIVNNGSIFVAVGSSGATIYGNP